MSLNQKQLEFVERVRNLSPEKRVHLRKAIGTPLKPGSKAWQVFFSLNPPFYNDEEKQVMFFVACVGALGNGDKPASVGDMLKLAVNRGGTFEDKLLSLTKDRADANGRFETKLYRFFGKEILERADLCEFLDGLLHWNHPKKYVQEKWCILAYDGGDDKKTK